MEVFMNQRFQLLVFPVKDLARTVKDADGNLIGLTQSP
jgi:hypothetical protein